MPESSFLSPDLPVNFRRVSEIQAESTLSFGDESLDRFLGGLPLGYMVFLYGSWQYLAVSELLCVRAQLDSRSGGLDSKAIFVDGGNTFDPYLIAEYAQRSLLDRDLALDGVLVSRSFTCHQLTSFITQMLPAAVHGRDIKLIVVSDIIKLYRDPDIQSTQTIHLFKTMLNSLTTTARLEKSIVLATSLSEKRSDSDPFLDTVKNRVNIILRFEEQSHFTRIILEKHPTRSGGLLIKQPTPQVLEEFLGDTSDG